MWQRNWTLENWHPPHPYSPKSLVYNDKTSPANRIIIECLYQRGLIIFAQVATPLILHKSNISINMPPYVLGKLANFIFAISSDHLVIQQINRFWRFKNIEGANHRLCGEYNTKEMHYKPRSTWYFQIHDFWCKSRRDQNMTGIFLVTFIVSLC